MRRSVARSGEIIAFRPYIIDAVLGLGEAVHCIRRGECQWVVVGERGEARTDCATAGGPSPSVRARSLASEPGTAFWTPVSLPECVESADTRCGFVRQVALNAARSQSRRARPRCRFSLHSLRTASLEYYSVRASHTAASRGLPPRKPQPMGCSHALNVDPFSSLTSRSLHRFISPSPSPSPRPRPSTTRAQNHE